MAKGKWLEDQAYKYVLDKIEMREWMPQEHIKELKVAEELDISRTPVRKAFQRLEDEHIIKLEPYKGAVILNPKINTTDFQHRMEFIEIFLVHYFLKLERDELAVETEKLKDKLNELEEALRLRQDNFEKLELEYWQLLLEESTNKYIKAQILETIRTSIPKKGKIRARLLASRDVKVHHLDNIIRFLNENNFPYVRREIRILLNQLNLNVIQGV